MKVLSIKLYRGLGNFIEAYKCTDKKICVFCLYFSLHHLVKEVLSQNLLKGIC